MDEIFDIVDDETLSLEDEVLKDNTIPKEEKKNLSALEMYGENLSNKSYITNPAIARENEIEKTILTMLTPDKSAILVGKAGIGKTAIVEGIAYKIQNNDVPNAIKGYNIIKVKNTSFCNCSIK